MSSRNRRGIRCWLTEIKKFLDTPEARSLRILSEYLYPLSHFRKEKITDTMVFFGSARTFETVRTRAITMTRGSWRGA